MERVEVEGLMYVTCEMQRNGMRATGGGGSTRQGSREGARAGALRRHVTARGEDEGGRDTRRVHESAQAIALSVRKTPEGRKTRTGERDTREKRGMKRSRRPAA